jgi:hypothetical protein
VAVAPGELRAANLTALVSFCALAMRPCLTARRRITPGLLSEVV